VKILFIVPPMGSIESYKPKGPGQKKYVLTPPYGLLSLISYAHLAREEVKIVDCNRIISEGVDNENEMIDRVKTQILEFCPDFVGVSALFNTCFPYLKIVREVRSCLPEAFILVGGGLATNLYKELLEEFLEIDAVCYGEGEIPLKKLLDSNDISDVSRLSLAWVTRASLLRDQMPQYEFVENLDEIPLVDFSHIDLRKYNQRSYLDKSTSESKIEVSIHTSRGCPFRCVFCANSKLHGKIIRRMSVERVIETIRHYRDSYRMTILLVEDDHFLHDKQRALEILRFIRDEHINVEFPNGVTVYRIDDDIARALAEARVRLVTLAIESGSEFVLRELIDKPLDVQKIKRAIANLKKYEIRIHAFIVIGIPGELDKHRKESLDLLVSLELDWVYVFIATPIVGSRLYEICRENEYIEKGFENHVVSKCNIRAPGVDPQKIEQYAYYMMIVLNFIENSNVKRRRYEVAEGYFRTVVESYPEQAIAWLMLSKIARARNFEYQEHFDKYLQHYDKHISIFKGNSLWDELIQTYFSKEQL